MKKYDESMFKLDEADEQIAKDILSELDDEDDDDYCNESLTHVKIRSLYKNFPDDFRVNGYISVDMEKFYIRLNECAYGHICIKDYLNNTKRCSHNFSDDLPEYVKISFQISPKLGLLDHSSGIDVNTTVMNKRGEMRRMGKEEAALYKHEVKKYARKFNNLISNDPEVDFNHVLIFNGDEILTIKDMNLESYFSPYQWRAIEYLNRKPSNLFKLF